MPKLNQIFTVTAIAVACSVMAPAANAQDKMLNDPQIANIAYTAGAIDVKAANQALRKTHNPNVKAFAQDMVRDHTAVNKQAVALVRKLRIKPQDNAMSRSLVRQANQERAKLAKLNGPAFDKAYVDNEVAYHHTVNDVLENTLIPGAHHQQLKNFLSTGLKIFKGHEEHARHLDSELK